ncbi:thiol:disulfide interchange protein [Aquitalea sp. FJL05]|uniref:DsbC family protein n=1 Tax=Aquitalea TaxID=407217 RepID=UPI000F59337A|nr:MULTISPECIES: DsbC family protein [Aquitalea]RQO71201.1 thiol:disulfide interchange protein [Aquitalea sp. FJL05]
MKTTVKALALAASMLLSLTACNANATPNGSEQVKKAFSTRFPTREVLSVSETPVKGVYEVVVKGKQIVYTDAEAKYLFVGDLIDTEAKSSLTEKKMAELNRVDFNKLPFKYAIKEVRGNGSRKLAVFTDPDCPYCKQLERESLPDITNVTIYTFLYPLAQLHPDAPRKARQIWCSKDRLATWTAFMRDGKELTGTDKCDTSALDKIEAMGDELGISGTPGLIFANGRLVPGAIAKDDIEKLLDAK